MGSLPEGTSLRLRKVRGVPGGETVYKLSHKVLAEPGDFAHAFITNIYLSEREHQLLSVHNARELHKRRYPYHFGGRHWAIDVFEGPLGGLILAEAEFDAEEPFQAATVPAFAVREVTFLEASTGGWLAGRGIEEVIESLSH